MWNCYKQTNRGYPRKAGVLTTTYSLQNNNTWYEEDWKLLIHDEFYKGITLSSHIFIKYQILR